MTDKLRIEPVIPRTVMRQAHRNNVPPETPLTYYKRPFIMLLLDTIISEITLRFEKTHCNADKVLCLVPSIICDEDSTKFQQLVKMYESDLPNPDAVDQELMLWKRKWSTVDREDRPDTLAKAIKKCDEIQYPNLFELLKIGCTLTITSSECARSFSAMRRLRTWLRASMTTERFGSMAIMNIHYNENNDYKEVSKLFFSLHPRKLHEKNLVFD